jgi:prepilin-type N-terminal cleavage/methylation domain-containing protein
MDGGARRARGSHGFTLAELLMVMVLVGIVAFVAVPRLSQNTIELSSQAEQVARDIRYAQTLSMTRGAAQGRYCIFFTATGYQLRNNNNNLGTPCTIAVAHPATGSSSAIVLSGGTTVTTSNLTGNYLEFDSKGQPTSLTAPASNATVSLNGPRGTPRSVVVSPVTGKATVQ